MNTATATFDRTKRMCEPTGNSWGDIRKSGRSYCEIILNGCLCRFHQHPDGRWGVRISGLGLGMLTEDTKRETWEKAKRITHDLATNPEIREHPAYTHADIRRHGGFPGVPCRNGQPI